MEYITSRSRALPETSKEMADAIRFNMWAVRIWPYREVMEGDLLYWHESPSQRIVWKTRITKIQRFAYKNKAEAVEQLEKSWGIDPGSEPYFQAAPSKGYCLVYSVSPISKLDLKKPAGLQMPRQGWLRVTSEIAERWLGQKQEDYGGGPTLDDLTPDVDLFDRLKKANDAMRDIAPERIQSVVNQTIRNDTKLIQSLKEFFQYRCQFPVCGIRIPKKSGGYYIEVGHVKPVARGGRSVLGNLLVLCPNHHKEFNHGRREITEQSPKCLRGRLNGREFNIPCGK